MFPIFDFDNQFRMSGGKVSAFGNVNSLLKGEGFENITSLEGLTSCFQMLFKNCTTLTKPPLLPSTTLANNCYSSMFYGCSSLTQAPELPATALANNCYYGMFWDCTSLTQAPELPATTILPWAYHWTFRNCTSLNKIKVNLLSWDAIPYEQGGWLENVSPTGTFICPKELPDIRNTSRIPVGWTRVDL